MPDALLSDSSADGLRARVWIATLVVFVCVAVLIGKLWHLQLIQGESFVEMSLNNKVRTIHLPSSRGRILDCNGHILAENRPSFTFSVVPGELQNPQEVIKLCSPILGLTPETMRGLLERSNAAPRFMSFPIKKNVTLDELSLIRSHAEDLKGAVVETRPYRTYPEGETLGHVVGTVGEISAPELSRSARMGYRTGDLIGKTGIERQYEGFLKGEEGWEQIEIDAKGRQLGEMGAKPPRSGNDVVLTVDSSFQRYVEEIFIHRAGAVVAVDPDTGRILAMVSRPGFDLNLFSPSITEREWKKLNSDPLHPLENRCVRGLYAPASTFKVVTALAALEEKVLTPQRTFTCKGEFERAGVTYRCWNHYGHGKMDLKRAIVESCDVYFYETGLRLGPERLARWSALFGLGKPTGIELPQELPGLVPTPSWKQRTYGEPLKDGETISNAIGQGYLLSTPVQLAMLTAALANGGKLLKPTIIRQIRNADGSVVVDVSPVVRWDIGANPDHLAFLRSALRSVVSDGRGTGKRCRIPGLNVRAKTGTSQVISSKQRTEEGDQIPYHERTHALFLAYVDDLPKKIALVVIVEHGGGGGASAAPLARKIICRYYGVPDPGDPKE